MRDAPGGLLPNFIRRATIMRLPVRWIAVLIRVKIFLRLSRYDLLHAANCAVGAFIARSHNRFRAKGSKYALAFMGSAARQTPRDWISQSRANHRVGNAGIPAGAIDDGFAALHG